MREIYNHPDLYAVEFVPQYRTMKINLKPRSSNYRLFHLGFPYMQFYLRKNNFDGTLNLHLTISKKPVQDLERGNFEAAFPFLPNVWMDSFKVCLKTHPRTFIGSSKENIKKAIELFWGQHFYLKDNWYGLWVLPGIFERNQELVSAPASFLPAVVKSFENWEMKSKKDLDYIMRLDWPHAIKNPFDQLNPNFRKCKYLRAKEGINFINRQGIYR